MIIALIIVPMKSNIILDSSLYRFTFNTGQFIQQGEIIKNATPLFTYQNILIALFIITSTILLIRFILNIFRIIKKIINCKKVDNLKTSLVFIEEKTLPYSFFRYIFVNQSDFENGKIEKELLMHEEAHCFQYHSIDIIIIELINVFLWFNPAIWLFRKAILLNHEFYADNKVLTNSDSIDYHQLIINRVIQNNSNYLVSNFKYSRIKNRIIMMNKSKPPHDAILRKIATISLFLVLGIAFTFSQENKIISDTTNSNNMGWISIIQKHKIDLKKFRSMYTFGLRTNDSLNFAVLSRVYKIETRLKNRIATFKEGIFIFPENNDTYWIITSETAYHDFYDHIIGGKNGKIEQFSFTSSDIMPIKTTLFKEFKWDTKAHIIFTTTSGYNPD